MREKLNKYRKNITSQYGEDGIIDFLIKSSKKKINKSCFEVGAGRQACLDTVVFFSLPQRGSVCCGALRSRFFLRVDKKNLAVGFSRPSKWANGNYINFKFHLINFD